MAAAWIRRDAEKRAFALHAAAVAALLLMPLPIWTPLLRGIGAGQGVAATIVLGLVALVAATLLRSGRWYACATAATVLVLSAWTLLHTAAAGTADPLRQFLRLAPGGAPASFGLSPSRVLLALLLQGVAVVLFTAWPLRARAAFEADRWAGRAAALAGPALFWPMKVLWSARLGDGAIGLLPLLLGAVSLAAALAERRARPSPDSPGLSRLVWFSGARFSSPPSPSRCSSRGSGSRSAGPSRARPSSCSGSGSITRASSGSRWASCPPRP
jgi:hypothetical protein